MSFFTRNSIKVLSLFIFAPIIFSAQSASAATITVSTFEDISVNDSLCSLREAVHAANTDAAFGGCVAGSGADTIVLGSGTYKLSNVCEYFEGTDLSEESPFKDCGDIDVTSSIIIAGSGRDLTTITREVEVVVESLQAATSSPENFRIFNAYSATPPISMSVSQFCPETCDQGLVFTLNDLTISNGSGNSGGAILFQSGSCEVSQLLTSRVNFVSNSASNSGGAIYVYGSYTGDNTNFTSNSALANGGAAFFEANNQCDFKQVVTASNFTSNTALKGNGGAIATDSGSVLDVAGSNFYSNTASFNGGAISVVATDLTITDSELKNNGLFLVNNTIEADIFGPPKMPFYGGALSILSESDQEADVEEEDFPAKTVLISNSSISENNALYGGAGIYIAGGLRSRSLSTLEGYSGLTVTNVSIRDSNISSNKVNAVGSIVPASLSAEDEDVDVEVRLFNRFQGGGIYNAGYGKLIVETSTIDSNSASFGGGIANAFDLELVRSTVSNNTSVFSDCKCSVGSVNGGSDYYVENASGGGGLYNAGAAVVDNSTISGNTTDGSGAGILNALSYAYLDFYFSHVLNTMASGIDPSTVNPPGTTLNNSSVINNLIVTRPEFNDLSAQGVSAVNLNNGGGLAALAGKITLSNTVVALNEDDKPLTSSFVYLQAGVDADSLAFENEIGALVAEASPTPFASVTATPSPSPSEALFDFAPDCYVLPQSNQVCNASDDFCDFLKPGIVSAQFNLIGNNLGCSAFPSGQNDSNDVVGTNENPIDPLVSQLGFFAGANVKVHLPQLTSALIDNGNTEIATLALSGNLAANAVAAVPCSRKDQLGNPRPMDGNSDGSVRCDIGAVEAAYDCSGTAFGAATKDACGVCGGNGSSCLPTPTPTAVPTTTVVIAGVTCNEQTVKSELLAMDGSALNLLNITKTSIKALIAEGAGKKKLNAQLKIANDLYLNAWNNTWRIPTVLKVNCTGASVAATCIAASNAPVISDYTKAVTELNALNTTLLAQLKRRKYFPNRVKTLSKKNDAAFKGTLAEVAKVPATYSQCF